VSLFALVNVVDNLIVMLGCVGSPPHHVVEPEDFVDLAQVIEYLNQQEYHIEADLDVDKEDDYCADTEPKSCLRHEVRQQCRKNNQLANPEFIE